MTPQSSFMIVAPVLPGRTSDLRALLAGMNGKPGIADPDNALVPFARFDRLHVARFVVLDDQTLDDLPFDKRPPDGFPLYLAFLGDCDGSEDEMLAAFAREAAPGLRRIFSLCDGFDPNADLLPWMRNNSVPPAVVYVNWIGRTVRQVREEEALHASLSRQLRAMGPAVRAEGPQAIRARLIEAVRLNGPKLSNPEPAPSGWHIRHLIDAVATPVALLALAPVLLFFLPFYLWVLRRREATDPVIAPRPDPAHVASLAVREDHDVSNSFSAIGSLKPGAFRLWTLRFAFWVVGWSARVIYTRGRLARVGTIHFARWVFLDNRRRLFFGSNYDGSLDSYMDDFINKVAYGLNLVFTNGVGYPRTDYLINRGAKDEEAFKAYIRRHQVPTDVWYKAYPGLTTFDLARNSRIREGLERQWMSDDETRQWLALIQ